MMEYLPREDGFPLGFALGKTILPRETFHHGIPSGMSYLYKGAKNPEKWLEPWHMDIHLRVLSESFPMNTNMTWFGWSSKIITSYALEESSLSIGRVN